MSDDYLFNDKNFLLNNQSQYKNINTFQYALKENSVLATIPYSNIFSKSMRDFKKDAKSML